jgi:predicted dehydrogenase
VINLALVGCAHIHTPGFIKRLKERSDVKVKSVWDHDAARAQKNATELGGASVVTDLNAIWSDSSISGVIVCSETNRHEAIVTAGAAAKKHLFVEKPLGMGATDSYAMASAIEKNGVIFQTGYFSRGTPIHMFLREHIQKGSFGKITRARHSNCHSGSLGGWFDTDWRWMADPKIAGCGAFGDLGTHSLDILMWFFGDVERVTGSIDVATKRYGDCDEFGEGMLRFKNGVVATLAAGWVDVENPVLLLISGTEGHALVSHGNLYFHSKKVEGADGKQPWTKLPEALPHAFNLFLDAVGGKRDLPLVGAREAAQRSSVMEAIYEGSRKKEWIAPK